MENKCYWFWKVKVKLMHQPGVKDGKSEVGDTDVEVEFPIVIK